ncbi:MAG: MFS transporter [Chloroflexota bacterium]|nr:MFS transporter [Chloroflexota bacterium]
MDRSLLAVIGGTFTLRFSTALTGTLLVYYLAELPRHGGARVGALVVGAFAATFFVAELVLSPFFGLLSDRWGHHRVMQFGPLFGAVAVIMTGLSANLLVLGITRWLEGASTAASVPSILGYVALATALDEGLRGRAVARFEAATLAGLGVGIVAAGPLYQAIGPRAFFLNAVFYMGSLAIYRYGVRVPAEARLAAAVERPRRYGWRRYGDLLRSSHVWLLAPTWIAVNAAIGLWTAQSIFQLVRQRDPRFADQLLVGGLTPVEVSLGLAVGLAIFFAGLLYWGNRFKRYRRTTIIFYGIAGGAVMIAAGILFNHSAGMPVPLRLGFAVGLAAGLFVLAGATPAALGLLADMSEAFPHDRGAIMGLYSVFLALGNIGGSLIGGVAAELRAIDGLLGATLVLLAIALVPLFQLRTFEHRLAPGPAAPPGGTSSPEAEPAEPARAGAAGGRELEGSEGL